VLAARVVPSRLVGRRCARKTRLLRALLVVAAATTMLPLRAEAVAARALKLAAAAPSGRAASTTPAPGANPPRGVSTVQHLGCFEGDASAAAVFDNWQLLDLSKPRCMSGAEDVNKLDGLALPQVNALCDCFGQWELQLPRRDAASVAASGPVQVIDASTVHDCAAQLAARPDCPPSEFLFQTPLCTPHSALVALVADARGHVMCWTARADSRSATIIAPQQHPPNTWWSAGSCRNFAGENASFTCPLVASPAQAAALLPVSIWYISFDGPSAATNLVVAAIMVALAPFYLLQAVMFSIAIPFELFSLWLYVLEHGAGP
jgi:hypothetical protein